MAISTALVSSALFICFNLLFFSLVSSTSVPCPPPAHPKKTPPPKPAACPPPPKPAACPPPPKPAACPPPPAKSKTPPPAKPAASCPKDALKLGVCANVLNGLINVVIGGTPSKTSCCSLLNGLADLDAAVCLCTALKANVLGINLNVPVSLSLLLNYCGKNVPSGYQCQ